MSDLISIKNQIIDTVKRASLIMTDSSFKIYEKNGSADIVTTSDLAVQHFLQKELKNLIPESGFFCEEEDLKETSPDYIWIIDPIDGTANYSRGISECCISVALAYKGRLSVGVVYNPYKDELFSAADGYGAELDGKPIHVSDRTFEQSIFCTALSLYRKEFASQCMDILMDVYPRCNDFRRFGTCALELCYLAAGKCELYFEIRVFPWDHAAASLVLKEAGGIISELDEKVPSLTSPSPIIAANNAENYKLLSETIKKYIPEIPYER